MRSPRSAMVSATVLTRSSSSEERKNGRRKGQWTRSPKVSRASRIRLNKSSGSAGTRRSVAFKIACHSSAGDGDGIQGVGAPVISLRSLCGSGSRSCRTPLPGGGALWRARKSGGGANAEHLFPAWPWIRSLAVQRAVNHQPRHFLHHVLEIEFRNAVALEIRRGIQEVDGVGYAVFDGELDGIHFVAQRLIDGLRIFHHTRAELRSQVLMVDQVLAFLGIIVNGDNVRLAESETAQVLSEIDEFLEGHAVRRSLVVCREEFLFVVHFVDVLPATTRKRLQDGRPPDVIEQPVPVDGIFQIVERFARDIHVAGITLLREEYGLGDGESQLGGHGVVKIFVVGCPPEWIVDDVAPLKNGVLQVTAVIFDFMRDAVDDDAVSCGLAHSRAAQLHKFRGHSIPRAELLDALDKRRRKAVFPPAEKANCFHFRAPVSVLWNFFACDRRQFTACAEVVRGW